MNSDPRPFGLWVNTGDDRYDYRYIQYTLGTFKWRIGGYLALIYNKRPILLRQLRTCRGLVEEDIPDFRLNILLKIGRILLSGPRRV